MRLTIPSFAKINLSLDVLGRRPDGCHELRTIVQTLALHDTLTFARTRRRFAVACSDPDIPTDERNLVWKAARALWTEAGRRGDPFGVSVQLDKRIPAEAGLGGGSSNAAVALLALDRLWTLRVPAGRLLEIAGTLGADVPFFLVGGTALGLGRGEQVYPMPDVPSTAVVLVKPPFGVSTAAAYGWLDAESGRPSSGSAGRKGGGPASARIAGTGRTNPTLPVDWFPGGIPVRNALEGPVLAHLPPLERVRAGLRRAGAGTVLLCGSGSTVFGLFDGPRAARAAAEQLAWPRHLVAVTRTLGRAAWSRRLAAAGLPVRQPIV